MRVPPRPEHEPERLQVLREHDVVEADREDDAGDFEDLVELASQMTAAPMALFTIIDEERQWFKATKGVDQDHTPREESFCAHQIGNPDGLMVVEDAREDPRFEDNPQVRGDLGIRFYAGCPLISEEGYVLGSLCVVDDEPRRLGDTQREGLEALGRLASSYLAMHRKTRNLEERVGTLEEQLDEQGLGRI